MLQGRVQRVPPAALRRRVDELLDAFSIREFADRNVTVNNLLPGQFDTDRLRVTYAGRAKAAGRSIDEALAAGAAAVPAGRFGNAAEFGAVCAFLCSAHAGYIAGQNVLVDGGNYPGTF